MVEIAEMKLRCACCGEEFQPSVIWNNGEYLLLSLAGGNPDAVPMILTLRFKSAEPVKETSSASEGISSAMIEDALFTGKSRRG